MPENYPNFKLVQAIKKTNLIISTIYSITCKSLFKRKIRLVFVYFFNNLKVSFMLFCRTDLDKYFINFRRICRK